MNKSDKKSDIETGTKIGQKSDMKSVKKIRKKSDKNKSDRNIRQKSRHEQVGQNKLDKK